MISQEDKQSGNIEGYIYKDFFKNLCGYFFPILIIIFAVFIVLFQSLAFGELNK
jgi:hypothetical protein